MIARVAAAVRRELDRLESDPGIALVVAAWPAAVGREIARNAWPARIGRDGTLHVHASSSSWAFELGQLEGRLRDALGELAPPRLRFVVGPLPEPAVELPERGETTPVAPRPEHLAAAAALAASIADEDLRKLVEKAVAANFARVQSDRSF